MIRIRRALVSVSDKRGVEELARGLSRHGIEVLSTGGTARVLREAGARVTEVAAYTGAPEILDGRVKTLHPKIHGGLLGRATPEHEAEMQKHGIEKIDLVVVNLYPFRETVARANVTLAEAIENIDIGGPSMIRSASKNHERVTVIVDPDDYGGARRGARQERRADERGAALPPGAQGVRLHRCLRRRHRQLADLARVRTPTRRCSSPSPKC